MEVTEQQLATWKQEHGEVTTISVTITPADPSTNTPADVATAYLKPADRNVVAYALAKTTNSRIVEAGEFILKNCFIGGDERLKITGAVAQGKAQLSAAIAANTLVEMFDVEVKNA